MKSIKKNFIYNMIYQILILIIPILVSPYLSRTMGANGIGTYSYTYSIVYYFMLLTLLGVNNYGNRNIAKIRSNKKEVSKTFWEIYIIQLIMGTVMLLIYMSYIFIFDNQYRVIAIIQSLFIISSILDINWFYFGLEEFKITITRNTIVKLGCIVLIFSFVKNSEDLWKYTLIMAGMNVLSQILMWSFLRKKVELVKIKKEDVIKHIKANFILFIPVIAVSLYKMMDKIMLGAMSNVTEVGYYENAEKIVNIPMSLITALGTVMLPRISNLVARGEVEKIGDYIKQSISFVMFMTFAMCFGLIAIGYDFAPLFFGEEFKKTGLLIILLSITLPFVSFANVIRTQYLIPKEKDKIYIVSVLLGAITNFALNFIFIPSFSSVGACIGTIGAEIIVMIYQTYTIREEIEIKEYIKLCNQYFIKSIIMFVCVYSMNYLKINNLLKLVLQIFIGICIYGILNIKYIFSIINIKKMFIKKV